MSKRRLKKILLITLILLCTLAIGVYVLLYSSFAPIMRNFNIRSMTNEYTEFTLIFDKVNAAVKYKIEITDDEGIRVYSLETNKSTNTFELPNLKYDTIYSVMVYAYDKKGEYRPANEDYKFKWMEPSIEDGNSIILNNDEDYILKIKGDLTNKNYIIKITNGIDTLEERELTENEITIKNEYFKDKSIKLSVEIKTDDVVVSSIDLFNNLNPLTDVVIVSPVNNSIVPFGDFTLSYTGGDYSEEYLINIYNSNNRVIKRGSSINQNVILSKEIFNANEQYRIEVIAEVGEYQKKSEVIFTTSDKEQALAVYLNKHPNNIKKGEKLELLCNDPTAKIYYTLDGSNPESMGLEYTEPFIVENDMQIKTVAISTVKHNSIIKTYDIHVGETKNLKVYISPSNQDGNYGVEEVGYTNEMKEMNDLSNYIIERLEEYNVKIYRNNPSGNIDLWNRDSNYLGVDLHLAIHSNASDDHTSYGIETWINNDESPTYSLANIMQNNLVAIYPNTTLPGYNRGVKYANGALGEVNDEYVNYGILVEVAHHDYIDDAKWIMENKKLIGYNMADSILSYYGII